MTRGTLFAHIVGRTCLLFYFGLQCSVFLTFFVAGDQGGTVIPRSRFLYSILTVIPPALCLSADDTCTMSTVKILIFAMFLIAGLSNRSAKLLIFSVVSISCTLYLFPAPCVSSTPFLFLDNTCCCNGPRSSKHILVSLSSVEHIYS